jgi:hypothetical protein
MGFSDALSKESDGADEREFKKLAGDMVRSFARMQLGAVLSPDQFKAHHVTDDLGFTAGQSLTTIKRAAAGYHDGQIPLGRAKDLFECAVPAMVRLLIQNVRYDDAGVERRLPRDVAGAIDAYEVNPTLQGANELVHLCVQTPSLETHWVFDNLARVTQFCNDAQQGQSQVRAA